MPSDERAIEGGAPRWKYAKSWPNFKKQIDLWEKGTKVEKKDRGRLLLDALTDTNPLR